MTHAGSENRWWKTTLSAAIVCVGKSFLRWSRFDSEIPYSRKGCRPTVCGNLNFCFSGRRIHWPPRLGQRYLSIVYRFSTLQRNCLNLNHYKLYFVFQSNTSSILLKKNTSKIVMNIVLIQVSKKECILFELSNIKLVKIIAKFIFYLTNNN